MIRRAFWFFIFSLMAISCLDQPDCFSLNNNIVGVSFKNLATNKADTFNITNISAEGTSVVFVPATVNTGGNLQLNLYKDTTVFHFNAGTKSYDLTMVYDSRAQFVSEDCGSKFVISGLRAFSNSFDSVRVASPTPKSRDIAGTNVEIFRCPNLSRIEIRFSAAISFTSIQSDFSSENLAPTGSQTIFLLPLNPAASNTTFSFQVPGEATPRTLTLGYTKTADKLYNACGDQVIISDLTLTSTTFTSAKVVRTGVQDPNLTNVEITL